MLIELRGREITGTDKAILFHRYGDKQGAWYPKSTIKARDSLDNGTTILWVEDWIYLKNTANAEPGPFAEPLINPQPELPLAEPPNKDTPMKIAAESMRLMEDDELLEHFDTVLVELHNRGVNIENNYGE